jgi:RNA polymerase sigma-70 factor (ECF subfamily)
MLLHDSRRAARSTSDGDLLVLEEQDRTRWNHEQIREGLQLTERALQSGPAGPYAIQAAISAVHAEAKQPAETDWAQIVVLYDVLLNQGASAIVELNQAAAIAMRDGPEHGLERIDRLLARGELANYHLAHSARADLFRRLGRTNEALTAYATALALTTQEPERRFIERRMAALRV